MRIRIGSFWSPWFSLIRWFVGISLLKSWTWSLKHLKFYAVRVFWHFLMYYIIYGSVRAIPTYRVHRLYDNRVVNIHSLWHHTLCCKLLVQHFSSYLLLYLVTTQIFSVLIMLALSPLFELRCWNYLCTISDGGGPRWFHYIGLCGCTRLRWMPEHTWLLSHLLDEEWRWGGGDQSAKNARTLLAQLLFLAESS